MASRNVYACLVHESPDCVDDLVRNLSFVDPDALILLYDGGTDPNLLRAWATGHERVAVHPSPRPMRWGTLHEFAIDCMRHALSLQPFEHLTVVDSDQLALRPGYSQGIDRFLASHPRIGMLGSAPPPKPSTTHPPPAQTAFEEIELWRPFLERFQDGVAKFPHWTFWPATVFAGAAARDLVRLWDHDTQLRDIVGRSGIWATEEVILPTLVALLGYEVAQNPFSLGHVKYRARYSVREIDAALADPSAYWIHPIPRRYEDPLRARIRHTLRYYGATPRPGDTAIDPAKEGLLLSGAIVSEIRPIEGWLSDDEADLLIAGCARALRTAGDARAVVEVGTFCGKATVALARVAEVVQPDARVYAVDPLDGRVGIRERPDDHGPTRARLERNLATADLSRRVEILEGRAPDVAWDRPIAFLVVDGLHDRASVTEDFRKFEPFLPIGAYVAFHDYADYFPGVKSVVSELLADGEFRLVHLVGSLALLQRQSRAARRAAERAATTPRTSPAAPAHGGGDAPLVSCIMPTRDRRRFVPVAIRHFLTQDYANRELVIVDDGSDPVADLIPADDRLRYVRLPQRLTVGAKRNVACEHARGEIIVHWDDDDWMSPNRLTAQIEALDRSGADLCGLDRVLYHEPASGRAWTYVYPRGGAPWVAGGTLCYRRSLWAMRRFEDLRVGEDSRFLWTEPLPRTHALEDNTFYVAMVHGRNTDPKRVEEEPWTPLAPDTLRTIMGGDLDDYREIVCAPDDAGARETS